jgi:hypothetical protein
MPSGPVNIGRGSARGRMGSGANKGVSKNAAKAKTVTMNAGNEKSMSWTKKPTTVGKLRLEPKQGGPGSRVVKDVPAKRRLGTIGKAAGSVKGKANKEITAERKRSGESIYDKATYGRNTVSGKKRSVPLKPSSNKSVQAAAKKKGK